MSVRLQGLTPYPRSLKWTIQLNYYKARGTEAWRSGEVPSDITSNYRAAYQHAQLLLASLQARYPRGVPRRRPIYVLELASGQGTYCSNFFLAFEDLCREHRVSYHRQLHYYFTDVVPVGLKAAAANPHLAELHREGRLEFRYLDALEPTGFTRGQLDAIVANYVFTVLPVTVLHKQDDQFSEKYIALTYEGSRRVTRKQLGELVRNPVKTGLMSALRETVKYVPIKLERRFKNVDARAALRETTNHLTRATFTYPEGGLQCFDALLPLMAKGGLFVVSDKAYARTLDFLHLHFALAATHGNSLSHGVNTPLLEAYLRRRHHGALRTADYHYGTQTLAVLNKAAVTPKFAQVFDRYYVTTNYNEEASSATSAARDYMRLRRWSEAVPYLRRALRWRPGDAKLLGRLGICEVRLGHERAGRTLIAQAQARDYFGGFTDEVPRR